MNVRAAARFERGLCLAQFGVVPHMHPADDTAVAHALLEAVVILAVFVFAVTR